MKSTCAWVPQVTWLQLPITYVMLYGPSAGVFAYVGATELKYASSCGGSWLALLVMSSGAWKPRCESGAEATAACQLFSLISVKPWPGPVIFHPTMPAGSHILANAIAVSIGVSVGLALNATLSLLEMRTTLPYCDSCLATAGEISCGPPNR